MHEWGVREKCYVSLPGPLLRYVSHCIEQQVIVAGTEEPLAVQPYLF